jgi:hypothetical protein
MTIYSQAYSLEDVGKSELPSHLAGIRPYIEKREDWDMLIEGYNAAISGAERCQMKGMKGMLDGYLEVSFACPEKIPNEAKPRFYEFWKRFDDEVILALKQHCNCNLH